MAAPSGETPPPSGRQHELRCADQSVTVVAVGGGIRAYTASGRDVLDGYAEDATADGGRGQLLVPWPNRVRDGRYPWQGAALQLSLTEPDKGHAIHGLARWVAWETRREATDSVTLGLLLPPQPGYPFSLELEVDHRLDADGLTVTQRVTNRGSTPAPYASGCHPYLRAGTDLVDDVVLTVPATTRLVLDDRSIPVGREPVAGAADFRTPRLIGDAVLDVAYTGLDRDGDGRATVRLEGPEAAVELWADAAHSHLMVFTGDTLQPPRRRRGLAVEPMTAAPDAFNNGAGVRVLEPGEHFAASWGIRPFA